MRTTPRLLAPLVIAALLAAPWLAPLPSRPAADDYFEGDEGRVLSLARAVDRTIRGGMGEGRFSTGSVRFDREWAFGTTFVAALGFGQTAVLVPSRRDEMLRAMERSLDVMVSPIGRAYDRDAWGEDPLDSLDGDHDHAAYLGYGALALGLHRLLVPDSRFAALHERMLVALERHVAASPTGMLETYPDERYSCDTAAAYAAIGLAVRHGRGTEVTTRRFERTVLDPRSGVMFQAFDASGRPIDPPRGSGTALSAYMLRYSDPALAQRLERAVDRHLAARIGGFGAIREYLRGHGGAGDIDSGPIFLGVSVAATGFDLGAARSFRRRDRFRRSFATTWLFGAPTGWDDSRGFVTGGPLGNAILFAMMTSLPIGALPRDPR